MAELILCNKPFDVLSQFTDASGRRRLAGFIPATDVHPAGRLDRDSDGLLLSTDDGRLGHRLTTPGRKTWRTCRAQVEVVPGEYRRAAIADEPGPTQLGRRREPHPRHPPGRAIARPTEALGRPGPTR